MAQLAIKGHPERGKEIIEILKMLGGKNSNHCTGFYVNRIYFINKNGYIESTDDIKLQLYCATYYLEKFEEKFPYKVGDKVVYKTYGIHSKIKSMLWNEEKEQVFYRLESNKLFVATSDELKPLKEETMEEININRIGFNGDKAKLILTDGYEFKTEGKDIYIIKKKSKYPKTYEECCKIVNASIFVSLVYNLTNGEGYSHDVDNLKIYDNIRRLKICRDAYWKIAGDWKPDWASKSQAKFIISVINKKIRFNEYYFEQKVLAFPTEEMRDAFYENFKDLIEQCKELL